MKRLKNKIIKEYKCNFLGEDDRLYCIDFYNNLTNRESIGFNWEMYVQDFLDSYEIEHDSNPFISSKWKSNNRKKGVDSKVYCNKLTFGVELKYHESYANIYPSYIRNDYLPRFNTSYDYNMTITNDKKVYTEDSLKMLKENSIKLFNPIDFIGFYYRKYSKQFKSHSYFFDLVASVNLNIVSICLIRRVLSIFLLEINKKMRTKTISQGVSTVKVRLKELIKQQLPRYLSKDKANYYSLNV